MSRLGSVFPLGKSINKICSTVRNNNVKANSNACPRMNVGGVTYWITSWPFIDVFKAGGGTSWPVVRSGTDKNGWPLEI